MGSGSRHIATRHSAGARGRRFHADRSTLRVLGLAVLLMLSLTRDARAYLDPGTGSFIFQIVVAAVCGVGFAVKMFWSRIRGLFTRSDSDSKP